MLNLRFVVAFAAVVEEGSFTRAAQRLNTSQSWVSEQVSKLEEQVGFQLLSRTSRKLDLTAKGEIFAKLAIELVQASNALESYVRSTQEVQHGRLRIGSVVTFAELPERVLLLDNFMRQHKRVEVQITYDNPGRMIAALRKLELDVVMTFDMGERFPDDLDVLPIASLDSYLLVPQEDPVARLEVMPSKAFASRQIVTLPRSSTGPLIDHLFSPLDPWKIDWVPAPEDDRKVVERLARVRRLSSFRWRPAGQPRKRVGDMVQLPLEETISISAVLLRNRNLASRNTERLWRIAEGITAQRAATEPLGTQVP